MTLYEAAMREQERHKAELDQLGVNVSGDEIGLTFYTEGWLNIYGPNQAISLTAKQAIWLCRELERIFIAARPDLESK